MTNPIPIATPEQFDFKRPDQWLRWKRRFEQFLSASGLDKESDERRTSTLLYCLGPDADDVLTSTNIGDDDRKKYSKVIEKFDAHFRVRRNVIFERARFNKRDQLESESAEEYITALYSLVETCEYGDMKDEMLRDRLVVGIRNEKVSETLQMQADLTLEEAKKTIRQKEAVREHTQQLHKTADHKCVEEVRKPQRGRNASSQHNRYAHRDARDKRGGTRVQTNHNCGRCGQTKHRPGDRCPARQAICRKCNKKGHYATCCFSKTVAASAQEVEAEDPAFLGALTNNNSDTSWTSNLRIAGRRIQFKLDTGAEVTAISETTYHKLDKIPLRKSSRPLQGPAGQSLTVLGQFTRRVSYAKRSSNEVIFVVRGLKNNLLGLPAIQNLHLIKKVDSTTTTTTAIRERFAKVFEGLGTLGEEYRIQLKDDAVPYSLYTPRNVPLPLRDKV